MHYICLLLLEQRLNEQLKRNSLILPNSSGSKFAASEVCYQRKITTPHPPPTAPCPLAHRWVLVFARLLLHLRSGGGACG